MKRDNDPSLDEGRQRAERARRSPCLPTIGLAVVAVAGLFAPQLGTNLNTSLNTTVRSTITGDNRGLRSKVKYRTHCLWHHVESVYSLCALQLLLLFAKFSVLPPPN